MYAAKSVGINVFDSSLGANEYVFGPFSTQQLLMKHASAMTARASNNPAPRCSPGRRTCERCVTHSANCPAEPPRPPARSVLRKHRNGQADGVKLNTIADMLMMNPTMDPEDLENVRIPRTALQDH